MDGTCQGRELLVQISHIKGVCGGGCSWVWVWVFVRGGRGYAAHRLSRSCGRYVAGTWILILTCEGDNAHDVSPNFTHRNM